MCIHKPSPWVPIPVSIRLVYIVFDSKKMSSTFTGMAQRSYAVIVKMNTSFIIITVTTFHVLVLTSLTLKRLPQQI